MKNLKIIAAIGQKKELGIKEENKMPWHLPAELKFFREQTLNGTVVMGRQTFASIGKPLPKRKNIILTRDNSLEIEGITVYNNIPDLLGRELINDTDVFIIGGASIYQQFIGIAPELILTEINQEFPEANVYFPDFDKENYSCEQLGTGEDNDVSYTFKKYKKLYNTKR